MKLFSKNSNMITIHQRYRQTDRQTDRQATCDRNTALCTKVHRAVMTEKFSRMSECQLSQFMSGLKCLLAFSNNCCSKFSSVFQLRFLSEPSQHKEKDAQQVMTKEWQCCSLLDEHIFHSHIREFVQGFQRMRFVF